MARAAGSEDVVTDTDACALATDTANNPLTASIMAALDTTKRARSIDPSPVQPSPTHIHIPTLRRFGEPVRTRMQTAFRS